MARTLMLFWMFWAICINQAWSQSWNACGPLIRQYEAAHGIPHKLLTAISLVESGRKVQGTVVAWPWSINANGKPYVFATKGEAITMVRKLRQSGITSIDVGCMQVNLKQHPKAFPTLDAAFDPATNIAYAARFLKAKKMNKGSWVSAVAHYHSSTAKFHVPYKEKVLKTWSKVQNGKMMLSDLLEPEEPSVSLLISDIEKHKGEFVKHIATPGGRHVPMVVRFAPYRGFNGGVQKTSKVVFPEKDQSAASIIFIDGKPKAIGKVIVNKMMLPEQKSSSTNNRGTPSTILHLSTKPKRKASVRKPKAAVISKFRAKSR